MNQLRTNWKSPEFDSNAVQTLAGELRVNPITARLLWNRGVRDVGAAEVYLSPNFSHLHDPMLLPDMDRASDRIVKAIADGEKIFVHGDYDVDGVTSTALYVRALRVLKSEPIYKVPHRKQDGYDLRTAGIEYAHSQGATLVITSDCGILAFDAVERAVSLGMDVIITDHHQPGKTLPPAYAVVNPHRADSRYPFPHLAGVGVAYKTMQAVIRKIKPDLEAQYLERFVDLVTCGTVADVMPLKDENRVLVWHGLKALATTKKAGLKALLAVTQLDGARQITTETISFGIAPRINAVGRMDDASVALDLMLTADDSEADRLALSLNRWNLDRQVAQRQTYTEALEMVAAQGKSGARIIVLASEGWNSGVVGIVAGKLVETFYRPAIVIGIDRDSGVGKGSARSIPGFDIVRGIRECSHLLTSCGGHEMAAGLGLSLDNLEAFEREINVVAGQISDDDLVPTIFHDGAIDPFELTVDILEEWESLAPFGEDNPGPCFASSTVKVNGAKRIGKDLSHMRLRICAPAGQGLDCVGWGYGGLVDHIGPAVDLLYTPQINVWNDRRSVQLQLRDLRVQDVSV